MDRKIVWRVEDEDNPSEIYCTTYQMRNFYAQFADGFFSPLDVMNYIQHHKVVTMMRKGDRILDVCCGRGLLLPMIRYYARDIKEYVGIDISEKNINEQKGRSGIKNIAGKFPDYYPFKITHIIGSAEDMDQYLDPGSFDLVVYTSSIEHMQREAGSRSLENCFKVMKPGSRMFLSCPNTMNKKDPYDTQYRAHLYEWDLDELSREVKRIGFEILDVVGIVAKKREFDKFMEGRSEPEKKLYERLHYLPTPWLMSVMPIMYPEASAEVLLIVRKPKDSLKNLY